MNHGAGSQLTLAKLTDVVTVIAVPAAALPGSGDTDVDTEDTPTPAVYSETALVTAVLDDESMVARRAPTRDALISTCCTMIARPTSTMPITSIKKIGATIANSTAAAPVRLLRRRGSREGGP